MHVHMVYLRRSDSPESLSRCDSFWLKLGRFWTFKTSQKQVLDGVCTTLIILGVFFGETIIWTWHACGSLVKAITSPQLEAYMLLGDEVVVVDALAPPLVYTTQTSLQGMAMVIDCRISSYGAGLT